MRWGGGGCGGRDPQPCSPLAGLPGAGSQASLAFSASHVWPQSLCHKDPRVVVPSPGGSPKVLPLVQTPEGLEEKGDLRRTG